MLKAFSIVKILIFFTTIAILAVATFVIFKPLDTIYTLQDETRIKEIEIIANAFQVYADENEGRYPSNLGSSSPITQAELQDQGLKVSQFLELVPDYLNRIPLDPSGNEYLIGLLSNSNPIVGTELTTGEFVTYPDN